MNVYGKYIQNFNKYYTGLKIALMAGKIIVHFHTLASGGDYLQAFFGANQDKLNKHSLSWINTELEATFQTYNQQRILSRSFNFENPLAVQRFEKYFSNWADALEKGNDILLSFRSNDLVNNFDKLNLLLDRVPQFAGRPRRYFITIGRHDYIFTDYLRLHPDIDKNSLLGLLAKVEYNKFLSHLRSHDCKDSLLVRCETNPQLPNRQALSSLRACFLEFAGLPANIGQDFSFDRLQGKTANAIFFLANQAINSFEKPDIGGLFAKLARAEKSLGEVEKISLSPENRQVVDTLMKHDWRELPDFAQNSIMIKSDPCEERLLTTREIFPDARITKFIDDSIWLYFHNNLKLFSSSQANLLKSLSDFDRIGVPDEIPLLSVLTMAYNHEEFIGDCIESVAAQQRSFRLKHIIVDDCSTDATRSIILEKMNKYSHIEPVFLSRKKKGLNIEALFKMPASRYVALCDGDDYFTDPCKLQKQIEFLERNKDCSLCFHFVNVIYENQEKPSFIYPDIKMLPRGIREKYYLADLLRGNFIQTNSVMYRWRFADGLPGWFRSDLCPSDWYWHLLHAEVGKIGFIPEIMSVYRRHASSVYATSFQKSTVEHRRLHGLGELKTFDAVDKHFNGRYFKVISSVANGVFADYCRIMLEEENSSYLDRAVELYPKFGANFLKDLKKVNEMNPAG